jgi:primosomal protein N' (replication factor Y)
VFLQTLQPDYPLFKQVFSYDWHGFVEQELALRKKQNHPPITRLTAIIISHKEEWRVQDIAMKLQKTAPQNPHIHIFGPAPAPINPLRGRYRWRFLIQTPGHIALHAFLNQWLHAHPLPNGATIDIDRDPYSFL